MIDSRKWAELVESDKLMIFVTGYRYTAGIMGGAQVAHSSAKQTCFRCDS